MANTKNYRDIHRKVAARPGAAERLAALRDETLAEIGLYELRRSLERSQTELAAELGISQSAVSQLERGGDVKLSNAAQLRPEPRRPPPDRGHLR